MHPADLGPSSLPPSSPPFPFSSPPFRRSFVFPPPSRSFSPLSVRPPLAFSTFLRCRCCCCSCCCRRYRATSPSPLASSPSPPSFLWPSALRALSFSSSSSSSSSSISSALSLLPFLFFFFLSFVRAYIRHIYTYRGPGECTQNYVPRTRERLELLSKTGASSRIMGGCRCDRAENATSSLHFYVSTFLWEKLHRGQPSRRLSCE